MTLVKLAGGEIPPIPGACNSVTDTLCVGMDLYIPGPGSWLLRRCELCRADWWRMGKGPLHFLRLLSCDGSAPHKMMTLQCGRGTQPGTLAAVPSAVSPEP